MRLQQWLQALRPAQWTKNLFVLAPLLFAGRLTDHDSFFAAIHALIAFIFLSSAVYQLNDVLDVERDRLHPEKRARPIASGVISVRAALVLAAILVLLAGAFARTLPPLFRFQAAAYLALMVFYCFALKRVVLLDAFAVSLGFVLRLAAGSSAIAVEPSHWLIICSFSLALFLSFAKRRSEMALLGDAASSHRLVLGAYGAPFLEHGTTILAGITAVCYTLYAVAPETVARFGTDALVYGAVFVLFGLLRYLHLAQTMGSLEAPDRLIVKDLPMILTVLLWSLYNAAVIYRVQLGFDG